MIALSPYTPKPETEKSPDPHRVLSLTMTAAPTFWFYVPYQPQGNLTGEFKLQAMVDGKLKTVHSQSVSLPATPRLLAVPLKAKSLTAAQPYRWIFSVACMPNEPSGNDTVTGWVQYESKPELKRELQQAKTPQQKILIYAQNGIWHETLTTLLQELCPRDPKLAQTWFKDLMQSVELTQIDPKLQLPPLQNCPKL